MSKVTVSKLSVYEELMRSVNDKLQVKTVLDGTKVEDDIWVFNVQGNFKATIDFSVIRLNSVQFTTSVNLEFNGSPVELSIMDFAKVLYIDLVEVKSRSYSQMVMPFKGIVKLFSYLLENEVDCLKNSELEDFISYSLFSEVLPGGIQQRFQAESETQHSVSLYSDYPRVLRRYKVENIVDPFTKEFYQSALNNVCLSTLDMTLADFKKGGSLNFLGLEVGKHYIDHCANRFEQYFQLAAALRQTVSCGVEILKSAEITIKRGVLRNENVLRNLVGKLLTGEDLSQGVGLGIRLTAKVCNEANELLLPVFRDKYNKLAELSVAFKLSTVNDIIATANIPDRFDTQEFIRSFLMTHYITGHGKTLEQVFREYESALNLEGVSLSPNVEDFLKLCLKVIEKHSHTLPNNLKTIQGFLLEEIGKAPKSLRKRNLGILRIRSVTHYIESAGVTYFVGLTGWRRSEYGFSLSDVKTSVNSEVLDNLYTPIRFIVEWMVPKTSGSTLVEREITSQGYLLIYMLNELNLSKSVSPALYHQPMAVAKGSNNSSVNVSCRVSILWSDFVNNYELFKRLDTLNSKYLNSELRRLTDIRNTLKRDLPKLYILHAHLYDSTYSQNAKMYKAYAEGTLNIEQTKILDTAFSEETKEKLATGDHDFSMATVRALSNELTAGMVYPSAHAFRHVWAEAVLVRYRGDVGKFIRANFKHLDERFFMNYLRDKETLAVYQVATRTVINGMVRQHIMAITDEKREYAGGFDRYLSKAVHLTKVVSDQEYERLAHRISGEKVIDIKPNAWGTCVLREGTEKQARCSVDGVPKRLTAKPRLCLGCVNADVSEGNYLGIVIYIKRDVAVCRNPKLPAFIKEPHIQTVKIALKRVEQLRHNSGNTKYDAFIGHLKETLVMSSLCSDEA